MLTASMKRYWTFCWGDHDALGGMWDCSGAFDTFEEAEDDLKPAERYKNDRHWSSQIFDAETREVYEYRRGAWRKEQFGVVSR
jgi:hypothetical protein